MAHGFARQSGLSVKLFVCALVVLAASAFSAAFADKRKVAYGTASDIALAKSLWQALVANGLVGPDRIQIMPYVGEKPHGLIQQVYSRNIRVGDRTARVVVKVNHRAKKLTPLKAYNAPNKHLTGYTVMFANKPGYDPENLDWFWVAYTPSGNIAKGPGGVPIAGRVGKRSDVGCIGCHRVKGGKDLEALTAR